MAPVSAVRASKFRATHKSRLMARNWYAATPQNHNGEERHLGSIADEQRPMLDPPFPFLEASQLRG
jgi:hypothetical protein